MEIVILDGYTVNPGVLSWAEVEKFGNIRIYDRTSITDEDEIVERIGNADIVISNKTPLTKSVIERCPNIKLISVLATGYNIVDTTFAREKGISVCNIPAYGTEAVAQFAIALMLELCCHVGAHSDSVFAGKWESSRDFCYWDYPLIELKDKTLGIIGFGKIGKQVGRIAKAMGMQVIANNPSKSEEGAEIAKYVELNELFEKSDIISLHCPQFPETTGIINSQNIAKMKDGVIIINNSRGGLIVEQDLADALNSGKVAGAGLDVLSTEPPNSENPLLHAKNCIITPHISWASVECRQRIINITSANIQAFVDNKPINVVN